MKKIIMLSFVLMTALSARASNEIQFPYPSADEPNIYCIIGRTADSKVWDAANGVWSTWADNNEPNYALDLTLAHKDFYQATFPAGIATAGIYPLTIYKWDGAEPNVTDDSIIGLGEMPWNGSAEITTYTTYTDINEIKTDVNEIPDIPTAAEVRAEMDNNSTKLAAIVGDTNEMQTDWAGLKEDINEVPTAEENRDAVFNKTGITAGGNWTFAEIIKKMIAWNAGNWEASSEPNVYEVLDAEDGNTPILDVNMTNYKRVTTP